MSISTHRSLSPEISGKTLNGKINFSGRLQGVPVHRQGIVGELLDVAHQTQTVLGVNIDNSLFNLEKRDFNEGDVYRKS